jgi:DNA-binding beta-propeller fold protein YncE
MPTAITITPDGALAFVPIWAAARVCVIDIANRRVRSPDVSTGDARSIAVTPDGKLAIVGCFGSLKVFSIANPQAEPFSIPIDKGVAPSFSEPYQIVISEKGNVALVAMSDATLIKMTLLK